MAITRSKQRPVPLFTFRARDVLISTFLLAAAVSMRWDRWMDELSECFVLMWSVATVVYCGELVAVVVIANI